MKKNYCHYKHGRFYLGVAVCCIFYLLLTLFKVRLNILFFHIFRLVLIGICIARSFYSFTDHPCLEGKGALIREGRLFDIMASGWALIQGRALIRGNTAVNTYGIKVPVRVHAIGVESITLNFKTSHYSNILSTVLKIVHTTRRSNQKVGDSHYLVNSNNQRSAGDNDRRSKHFCSNAVLCVGFT